MAEPSDSAAGAVISPNTTLTLECVPTRMAGAAGGALQTGRRIGTAIGTAVLTTVFRLITASDLANPLGAAVAIGTAVGFTLIALVIAVLELRAGRERHARGRQADHTSPASL